MRKPGRIARTVLLLLALGASSRLFACDWPAPENFEEWVSQEFDRAALVFVGTVRASRDFGLEPVESEVLLSFSVSERQKWLDSVEVEFVVDRIWKGDTSGEIRVRTESPLSSCSITIEVGVQFLVFAYSIENDDALHVWCCTPTSRRQTEPSSYYQRALEWLRQRAE